MNAIDPIEITFKLHFHIFCALIGSLSVHGEECRVEELETPVSNIFDDLR